jgi:hypothetical protein
LVFVRARSWNVYELGVAEGVFRQLPALEESVEKFLVEAFFVVADWGKPAVEVEWDTAEVKIFVHGVESLAC